jgi:hypothetical protein
MMGWMVMLSSCGWQTPLLWMAHEEVLAADTGLPAPPPPEDTDSTSEPVAAPAEPTEPIVPPPDPNHPTDPTM